MNFLKRVLFSIKGHKGRTIILFAVFTVIGSMLLGSLIIGSASKSVMRSVNSNLCAQIKIKHKPFAVKIPGDSYSLTYPVEKSFEKSLADIPHITLVNHITLTSQIPKNFNISVDNSFVNASKMKDIDKKILTIKSATDTSKLTKFTTGNYKLLAGRHLNKNDTDKTNVLINEKTAKENSLKVSDKITAFRYNAQNKSFDCTYTIVGIFSAPIVDIHNGALFSGNDPGKLLYTSMNKNIAVGYDSENFKKDKADSEDYINKTIKSYSVKKDLDLTEQEILYECMGWKQMMEKGMRPFSESMDDVTRAQSLVVFVDSPKNVSAVIKRLKSLKDGSSYNFTTNTALYNRITVPVSLTQKLCSIFSYIVFGAGLIMMALIVILSFRGRKHEFGILLSVGEKKYKILLQILFETMVPVLLSFIVSVIISVAAAQNAGNLILQKNYTPINRKANIMTQRNYEMSNNEFNANNVEQISKITIRLTSGDIAVFAGLSLIIVLAATSVPIAKFLRLSPKEMLLKKNSEREQLT